jgi:hypothetical protein
VRDGLKDAVEIALAILVFGVATVLVVGLLILMLGLVT